MEKIIGIGIILLLIGAGSYPAIAGNSEIITSNILDVNFKELEKSNPKEYLFETIIEIANNPEIIELFEDNDDIFAFNYNYNILGLQLLLSNPVLLFQMFITQPTITYDYLDDSYYKSLELINLLGIEKVFEIISSTEISNIKIVEEFKNILINNLELHNRIIILSEMNNELISDFGFEDYPVICLSLLLIFVVQAAKIGIYYWFVELLPFTLELLFRLLLEINIPLFVISFILLVWVFECLSYNTFAQ